MLGPSLRANVMPAEERDGIHHIECQLGDLGRYAHRFGSALDLMEQSGAEMEAARLAVSAAQVPDKRAVFNRLQVIAGPRRDWIEIAKRDAIITIWDFARTVYEIRNGLDRCPSLNALVDRPDLERVIRGITDAFPHRKTSRHVAAHPADMSKSPDEIARHSFAGDVQMPGFSLAGIQHLTFSGTMLGDGTVVSTYEGKVIEVKINRESHQTLNSLRDQMYACFANAEQTMLEMALARQNTKPA